MVPGFQQYWLPSHVQLRFPREQEHPLVLRLNVLNGLDLGAAHDALDHHVALLQERVKALASDRRLSVSEEVADVHLLMLCVFKMPRGAQTPAPRQPCWMPRLFGAPSSRR